MGVPAGVPAGVPVGVPAAAHGGVPAGVEVLDREIPLTITEHTPLVRKGDGKALTRMADNGHLY